MFELTVFELTMFELTVFELTVFELTVFELTVPDLYSIMKKIDSVDMALCRSCMSHVGAT